MTPQSLVDGLASPYSRVAARLVDQGYSALPVAPGTKVSSICKCGGWLAMRDWTRYCSRRPTDLELRIWSTWSDAGICVCMGVNSVCAIDVDTDDWDIIDAIEAVTGLSPVQKRGRKGHSHFFRAPPAVAATAFKIGGKTVLDLLAAGRQSVIPATIHPDTGKPYQWLTNDTLEHIHANDLPWLPEDAVTRLKRALLPFGYMPETSHNRIAPGDGVWDDVKVEAARRPDAWTSALGGKATPRREGGFRIAALWRGGVNDNIQIYGDGGGYDFARSRFVTAIDVVMEARSCGADDAYVWLRDRLWNEAGRRQLPVQANKRKARRSGPVRRQSLI